jgi:hypothetical protein
MTEKKRVTMALGDQVTVEVEMCQDPGCVLAAGHPPGEHRERRVSMLACPHNVPNFGPACPICDVASAQLGGKLRYELCGDPRPRDPVSEESWRRAIDESWDWFTEHLGRTPCSLDVQHWLDGYVPKNAVGLT